MRLTPLGRHVAQIFDADLAIKGDRRIVLDCERVGECVELRRPLRRAAPHREKRALHHVKVMNLLAHALIVRRGGRGVNRRPHPCIGPLHGAVKFVS